MIGPNGAGKTTLACGRAGLLRARGRLIYDGVDLGALRRRRAASSAASAWCPSARELFGDMSVVDNLLLGAYRRRRNGADVKQNLAAVYARFPRLAERRRQKAQHAVRRRTPDAGARPRADGEAAAAAARRAESWARAADRARNPPHRRLARDIGVSILLVEQNARAALETADYGYVLESGEITHQGPPPRSRAMPAWSRPISADRPDGAGAYDDVVLAAPVTVPYVRFSTKSAHWFLGRALAELIAAANIPKARIDGLAVASFTLAPDTAVGLTQHLGVTLRWLDHVPMGGASGIVSMRRAARAVQAGDAEIVACIAGDTNHTDSFRRNTSAFSQFSQDAVYPYGSGGPNTSFAFLTAYYMRHVWRTTGRLRQALRRAAQQRAAKSARAFQEAADARGLSRRPPDRRSAAAVRLRYAVRGGGRLSGDAAGDGEKLGLRYARLLGAIERHNAFPDDPVQFRGGWALDCEELYAQAGIGPPDIDFLEAYDDYPVINVFQIEDLGFCRKGEGPAFIRGHTFEAEGSFPFNTSGGQLSAGQAGAAGGHLGVVEAIRQLTGQTHGAVVADARHGVVSGFGMINYDRGVCTGAAVLAAA